MKIHPNDPAHPHPNHKGTSGMSKREYFAALALQGIASSQSQKISSDSAAKWAVICADALINELNKTS